MFLGAISPTRESGVVARPHTEPSRTEPEGKLFLTTFNHSHYNYATND